MAETKPGFDLEDKRSHFKRLCETEGRVEGCHSYAEFLQLVENDTESALSLFRRNCDPPSGSTHRRYGPSCFSLATMLLESSRAEQQKEAPKYFEKACVSGSMEGCHNMGVLHRRGGHGVDIDLTKAENFFQKACDKGLAKSCLSVAILLMNRSAKPQAFDMFERACVLGSVYGCSNAVVMLKNGDGIEKDLVKAEQLQRDGEKLAKELGMKFAQQKV